MKVIKIGTRSLTIVCQYGEYKVAQYGQWDGYPSGIGVQILKFLKCIDYHAFGKAIENVSFYTEEELDRTYPSNDYGAGILKKILFDGLKKVRNDILFAANSLFCEWAYVIDLSEHTFEVYSGGSRRKLDKNDRFYFLKDALKDSYNPRSPIKIVKSYNLYDLPSEEEFIRDLE